MKKIKLIFALMSFTLICKAQVIPVTEEQLFKAFKQDIVHFEGYLSMLGGGGNCASIALIKAAIGTFGINGVFKDVKIDSAAQMVHVTRKDNVVIDLTFDRLNDGKEHFFIKEITSSQISDYAAFCFAVMCRAKQLQLGYNKDHFYRGVDNLNKGESAEDIYKLLGLKQEPITDITIDNLKKYKNLVLYNAPHAVYSSSGNYDEFFRGTINGIEPITRLNYFHCKTDSGCPILGAYILK